jgi:hypothetical protein
MKPVQVLRFAGCNALDAFLAQPLDRFINGT